MVADGCKDEFKKKFKDTGPKNEKEEKEKEKFKKNAETKTKFEKLTRSMDEFQKMAENMMRSRVDTEYRKANVLSEEARLE